MLNGFAVTITSQQLNLQLTLFGSSTLPVVKQAGWIEFDFLGNFFFLFFPLSLFSYGCFGSISFLFFLLKSIGLFIYLIKNKMILTTRFPTLNEYITAERRNRFIAGNIKKKFTAYVKYEALVQLRGCFNSLYDLNFKWTTTNNKSDPDNIYFAVKFILDGLVESKRLAGDGRRYIRNISHTIETTGIDSVTIEFIDLKKDK